MNYNFQSISQVAALVKKGIDAIAFGNSAGLEEKKNNARVLGGNSNTLPALAYTIPEHFSTVSHKLHCISDCIKMLEVNEAHNVFDRSEDFRCACSALASIHKLFPDKPVVALTATLLPRDLEILSTEYLSLPVSLRGSVDRPNIRLSIAKYACKRKKLRKGEIARGYMDLTSEDKEMTEFLSMEHKLECKSFYGKNMKLEQKTKIMEEFSNQGF